MINTVPRGVVLGDVLKPIKVKVGRSFLIFNNTLALHTEIRVCLSHYFVSTRSD